MQVHWWTSGQHQSQANFNPRTINPKPLANPPTSTATADMAVGLGAFGGFKGVWVGG